MDTITRSSREVEARLNSRGGWGVHGSAQAHMRYAAPRPQMRRLCSKCKDDGRRARSTHVGMANGVVLMSGCEWHVYQWIAAGRP
jgi:hypothetical protein